VPDALAPVVLACFALLYARGLQRLHTTVPGRREERRRVLAFAGAVAAILIVVSGPLDHAAHTSLPMHMVQHIALLGVAPPLLAASALLTVAAAGLPGPARRATVPWLRRLTRSQSRRWGTWMVSSFALATAALVAWHLPGPYDAAVHSDPMHALEHLSFVATATLFWWMALGAGRPARRGAGVLVVFVSSLPATALGILLVLATTPWYDAYGTGPGAVRDQQVAGAVMWGFGSLALVVSGAALFAGWLAAMDRVEHARAVRMREPW